MHQILSQGLQDSYRNLHVKTIQVVSDIQTKILVQDAEHLGHVF
jgi:hypothetical protein